MKLCSLILLIGVIAVPPLVAEPRVEPPVAVRTVEPSYPYELRREGTEGFVLVSCVVNRSGSCSEISIERSTHVGFNQAAVDAVKKWKFKPALVDGVAIDQKIMVPLKFIIEKP